MFQMRAPATGKAQEPMEVSRTTGTIRSLEVEDRSLWREGSFTSSCSCRGSSCSGNSCNSCSCCSCSGNTCNCCSCCSVVVIVVIVVVVVV